MKALILAAGQGTRLRPLTDERPKCMVEYQGRPLIEYTLDALSQNQISKVGVVVGYCASRIAYPGVVKFFNSQFAHTNMVESLFCAEKFLDDDTIVIYGDIIFRPDVLSRLIAAPYEISVVIDLKWQELWAKRMEDPLLDAETLKLNNNGQIVELGKKPKSFDDIQGQYIGLFKLRSDAIPRIKAFYHTLDREAEYDGKQFHQMYMTSFLQRIADELMPLTAVSIEGGWLEVDSPGDLTVQNVI